MAYDDNKNISRLVSEADEPTMAESDEVTINDEILQAARNEHSPAEGGGPNDQLQQLAANVSQLSWDNEQLRQDALYKDELIDTYRETIQALQAAAGTRGKDARDERKETGEPPMVPWQPEIRPETYHWLIRVLNGGVHGEHLIRPGLNTLGSSPDNHVRLSGTFVSRHHAKIIAQDGGCVLVDLDSTNGTYVNNRRITRRTLRDGDTITVGTLQLSFAAHSHAAPLTPDANA